MDYSNTAATMAAPGMALPGFRFHPTEEELLDFYLKSVVSGKKLPFDIIGFLNIYHHEPWDLPGLARNGEREWYFFVPRDRKHENGGRPNRTTEHGFWKATGCDRHIRSLSNPKRLIGLRKTLVFYMGRAPRGSKTDWIMNEYRMPDASSSSRLIKDAGIVLCKIYRKATSLKVLEQRATMEDDQMMMMQDTSGVSSPATMGAEVSMFEQQESFVMPTSGWNILLKSEEVVKEEEQDNEQVLYKYNHDHGRKNKERGTEAEEANEALASVEIREGLQLKELQLPKLSSFDWAQDSFWTQLRSPWIGLDNWALTPLS